MAYPTRGAWAFTNLDRSFSFYPRLKSVSILQENPTALSTLEAEVVVEGANASVVFANEDHCEATFRGDAIWRGHLKDVTEDRSDEGGPKIYRLTGQDYTAKLDDAIIRRRKRRKRERVRRRVRWILSKLRASVWTLDGRELDLPSTNPYVEAHDYFGMSVREALEHVASELRLTFYVDLDNVFHIFRTDTTDAPIDLDNEAPDYSTTFPFREWTHETDSAAMGNAVLVEPELRKRSRWSTDAASIAAYTRQERFVSDSNLKSKQAALNVGLRSLAEAGWPEQESRLICWEPGLAPGQTVHVREALWDHDFDRIIQSVEIRAVDPHDDAGTAYLVSALELTDRRRPKGRHKGGGGSTSDSTNKVIRGRPGATVDTSPHLLDSFLRDVSPPSMSDGSTIVAGTLTHEAYAAKGRDRDGSDIPFAVPSSAARGWITSTLGQGYYGWSLRPAYTSCGGFDNAFCGWLEGESWYSFTVPSHPADMAGIKITLTCSSGDGYGASQYLEAVALDALPTDTRQGEVIGKVAVGDSTQLLIPAEHVPAAGSKLYIGLRTSWETDAKEDPQDYICGWIWPHLATAGMVCAAHGAPYAGYSGRVAGYPSAAVWRVWSSTAPDLGSLDTPDGAPWIGGSTVRDAGYEGAADAWEISSSEGGYFRVESEEPAGKGIYVVGEREDDDEPYGPWSDVSWACEITYSMDAHGSEVAAGERHIQLSTTGEGEKILARIQLGDSDYAEGIYVAGPEEEAFTAKAMTLDEQWRAKIDCRSGRLRAKVWKVADGQPAEWDVEVAMGETEDELDRYTLWVRAGNGAGSSQAVTIHRLRGFEGANEGQRVVKEYIGFASGTTNDFPVAHRYRVNTLRGYVNGTAVAPLTQDPTGARFAIDFYPTADSLMRATYVADTGDET